MDAHGVRVLLTNQDIRPSYTRLRILEYLMKNKSHPTVDEIYSSLVQDIPTLSKTTVYNTLNLLIEKNIARVVTIEKNETRYDADISDHGHFKCLDCGVIFDFPIQENACSIDKLDDFLITEKHFYFQGTCPSCRTPVQINHIQEVQ